MSEENLEILDEFSGPAPREIQILINNKLNKKEIQLLQSELNCLIDWEKVYHSGPINFTLSSDKKEIFASTKINRDQWDLSLYLKTLKQLSRNNPELFIKILFDDNDDEDSLHLKDGIFGPLNEVYGGISIEEFFKNMDNKQRAESWEGCFDILILKSTLQDESRIPTILESLENEIFYFRQLQDLTEEKLKLSIINDRTPLIKVEAKIEGNIRLTKNILEKIAFSLLEISKKIEVNLLGNKWEINHTITHFSDYVDLYNQLQIHTGPLPKGSRGIKTAMM